jgi:hypothetical protein
MKLTHTSQLDFFFSHKGKIEGGEARKEGKTEEGQGEIQRPGWFTYLTPIST